MKNAPTLIDELYRISFLPGDLPGWKDKVAMRQVLFSARRFVADERMSAFMADLALEAFIKKGNRPVSRRIADSLRVSARLPHESVWIEYDSRAYHRRSAVLYPQAEHVPDNEVAEREGWLIQQHPAIPTACMMHIFVYEQRAVKGSRAWTFPWAYAWVNDDSPLPWHTTLETTGAYTQPDGTSAKIWASEVVVGLIGYRNERVGCVRSPLLSHDVLERDETGKISDAYMTALTEWQGVVRRAWALLATLDHLPLGFGEIRQSKGFLARGRIRKFLDHQTITLNIPAKKDTRVIARQAVAQAHRKRHEVRGHWRDDWRNPPSKRCPQHLWVTADDEADHIVCELCRGRQIYIHKHERGDASLGYVTHDYALKHETQPR